MTSIDVAYTASLTITLSLESGKGYDRIPVYTQSIRNTTPTRVDFKTPNQDSKANPDDVQVDPPHADLCATVAKVALHEQDTPTTIILEFGVEASTAHTRESRSPTPVLDTVFESPQQRVT